MIHYPSEWMASDEENDTSGVATYQVDGREYVLRLESVETYHAISEMLSAADMTGRQWMRMKATDLMDGAIKKARCI